MKSNPKLGISLMAVTMLIFAVQDGISQYLAREYNVFFIVMVRYWFFALFVVILCSKQPGGLRKAISTKQPFLQVFRGALLALEVIVMITSFTLLGLIESHAIFSIYPLLVAALSGPVLKEFVGWKRWSAIFIGFIGVMIILKPSNNVFSLEAIIPLVAALMFALYSLLTRYAARQDTSMTSFFWTGIIGAVVMSIVGSGYWIALKPVDWAWLGLLCILACLAHYLLIKCYELSEASSLQPFAYLQLLFATIIGLWIFSEKLEVHVVMGAFLVVLSGLFAIWRERQKT
ncbi:MAG: DMT family transporter [Rhodobacteraceae bacterium]|mgnify:FL=1|jgi:drug/metabolite transporter (DMT)-like permease|nr:MAG: DMT family transporter [Paracoccaceae bacterium]